MAGWRLARGFPASEDDIGTARDSGDLLGGWIAQTERGPRSSTVATYRGGILGFKNTTILHRLESGICPYAGVVGGTVETPGD